MGQKEPPRLGSTTCYGQALARKSHRDLARKSLRDSAIRFVTAKYGPERATEIRRYGLLRPNVGQKEPPRLGSTICYGQDWARKSNRNSVVRFVTAKSWPERGTETRQYDLLRPRVGQKEPPRLGSTICGGQTWARKSHQDSAVFVTAKRGPPRLCSKIYYGQEELAKKSHRNSAVRFVTAKRGPERATKFRQYDLLRPNVGQKEPPRHGSTICYGQTWARKSYRDSAVRCVSAKRGPERAAKTRQYHFLPPNVGQNSHQDSAVRFVAAKSWPERATETRQYDLWRPNVGQKEPPRLGSTICYGQEELARKSHRNSAARFVTAKSWPKKRHRDSAVRFVKGKRGPGRTTKTRQYDLLRPNVGQKELPKFGSTILYFLLFLCFFVTTKSWPQRATKTRQYDLLRPTVGQKEPPGFGSTICYDQTWARKNHRDSAVRFVTAKQGPERATETRQFEFLRPRVGQKEPPRLGSTICCGQELARKSHRDSAVRFVAARRGPEKATKTRQYDLWPNVGQKEPSRLGSTICYGQTWARKSHRDSAVRFVTAKSWPERATKTRCYGQMWARKSHRDSAVRFFYGQELARKSLRDSAVRFVAAKRGPERATKTRQYDLLRPNVGQKEPPRHGSTICYGQTWARKSYRDSAVRCVSAKRGPETATKTRQYNLLPPKVGQKQAPRLGSTICYGQTWARKSHRDTAVRFVTAKRGPERATETRQFDVFRPNVGQKEPPSLGSTIYGQTWARKSHQDSAARFVTTKRGPEGATETRQYDLLPPNVGQKDPPRLGSTICYGQTWARKSHRDSAVRPERVTETRQYDLLRLNVGQKEPLRLGSTTCYGQMWARKSHRDTPVRFVTARRGPERATKTRARARKSHQDSAVPFLTAKCGPEQPSRLGSTICCGQELARKSHRDSAVRFVETKRGPERAFKTRQYDCYGQEELARKSHRNSAARFVTAKSWPERGTETRQYDLLRANVGQEEPPRLGNTICYGQTWARKSYRDSAVRFLIFFYFFSLLQPRVGHKEPPRLGSTICYGQPWARKSHRDSAVRFVMTKRGPERTTETRQYELLRPRFGQKEPPRLGSTICNSQQLARKSHRDSAVRFVTAKCGPERATETRQYDL